MRDQPVDGLDAEPGIGQHFARRAFEYPDRRLEHRLAVHPQEGVTDHATAIDASCRAKNARLATIGMQPRRQDARRIGRFQHDRAGAVAEQHAGGAIVPVENPGKRLGADHQRAAMRAAADQRVGQRHRVDESTAHCLHVEGGGAMVAEPRLHQARG